MSQGKKQIGRILLQQRALTPEQLERALSEGGGRLASRLIESGTITDVAALKALSEQHGIPGIDLAQLCLRLEDLELLPREIAEKHLILPVLVREDRLFIAMANPRERTVLDELEFVTGKKAYPYVALETSLTKVIQEAYTRKARGEAYYIGPRCPPEVLKKYGLESVEQAGSIPPSAASIPPPDETFSPLTAPGVVVDDQIGRVSQSREVEDDHFGETSRELSVVAMLPEAIPDSAPGQTPAGAKTVLVVDDEDDIRKMLKRLLTSHGYRVLEADRGLAALHLVKEQTPDLIILDAMLPEVHGFDIARRIKGSARYGHIPIIMISAVYRGWRYAEDLKQSCGVDFYLEKPFRIADVLRGVEVALSQQQTAPRSEARAQSSEEAEACLEAGVKAYQAGQVEVAIAHLQQGLAIDPLAYRLHLHLGLLYGKQGQVYEAISELETAVDINDRHFPAVKNLAILYQKAGFRNKAAEMWERALKLAPDEPTRTSIKQNILNLL
ncbi:MAG: response regulator [Myxococcales bacterium]|nr:response regulator [Myxococcales bacterium]